MNVSLSRHSLTKGFDPARILAVIDNPDKITTVSRYPNQRRFIGDGLAVIVDVVTNTAVTVYLDGVITPMRDDQRNDPRALNSVRLRKMNA